ncbi:MAG: iron ABC transporter permease [Anaerolineae bacterium]|nr:iron ABC transporter permease [Anaerolineae bacterium]
MHAEAAPPASASHALGLARRRLITRLMIIALSSLLLLGALILALGSGAQSIAPDEVIQALQDRESVKKSVALIIHEVRLPRALAGALVGLNLAVAGALLQGVVRSPLGDPYILGVSAGGGFAAAATSLRVEGFPPDAVPIMAFIGALIGALIVYAIAWDGSGVTTTRLALAGVALTAMMSALTTTVVVMSVQGGGQIIFQWLVGGLYTASWREYHLIVPYSIAGFVLAMLLAKRANILALGDEMAQGLGLRVEWTRFLMSAVAAVLAGSAVAVAGLIAFVGLLVPFVARRLVGSDFRFLLPVSALLGAALMVSADTAARVTFPALFHLKNIEFPVGIITALIGGPLFLWLVRARRTQW